MRVVLLIVTAVMTLETASAQLSTVKLNGGLEAELLTLGRSADHHALSVAVKISNKGKSTAELLMIGGPVVTDNTGGHGGSMISIGGLAQCVSNNPVCYGSPRPIDGQTIPLQAFTVIDPDVSITATMTFKYGNSSGPRLSFSAQLAYRLVADVGRDATLADAEKYKQFRTMTLSFQSVPVVDGK